jgi:hypothetical protein
MLLTLPGGYVDQHGTVHDEVELSPLTGRDEEFLHALAADTPPARIITELLGRCIERLGSLPAMNKDLAREMLVGDREYLVMRLFELTCGTTLDAVLICPGQDCGKPMDVTLSLAEMASERRPISKRHFRMRLSSDPSRELEFRLPTGADQEALAGIEDDKRAVTALLARCTGLDQSEITALSEAEHREIESAMEKLAPQVDVEIEATCPECGRLFSGQAAWPVYCLGNMMSQSAGLEREVHLLAWHYHWSESDVLSMPRMKRRRYIALIEEELNRVSEA